MYHPVPNLAVGGGWPSADFYNKRLAIELFQNGGGSTGK